MKPTTAESHPLHIATSLAGRRLFVTGATGFLSKVLVEQILWSVPEVGEILLLIRPQGDETAQHRLHREVLDSPLMARLRARHQDGWQPWASSKVHAVEGDLEAEHFGLSAGDYAHLASRVDAVVASAATVTFDERLDRAVQTNARGALCTLGLARDAGNVPLVHVSTCFVSGKHQGPVLEQAGDSGFQAQSLLAELDAEVGEVMQASADDVQLDQRLVQRGAVAAKRYGFNDIYTLTKALAERLIEEQHDGVPVAVVRPAIVESAVRHPRRGWIDAVRVADPLLVAYGRGRIQELPGSADARLEIVPVDYVANALLAALADLSAAPAAHSGVRYYQVGSNRNPVTLGELLEFAREGFEINPLRDDQGNAIEVPQARFVPAPLFRKQLAAQSGSRFAGHLAHLLDVYGPYLNHDARYDDTATQELFGRLSSEEQLAFPFDLGAHDWSSYISRTHIPGLIRFALRAEGGEPPPASQPDSRSHGGDEHAGRRAETQAPTLYGLLEQAARRHPSAIAFQAYRNGRWLRYTYGEALTTTANIASCLALRHGIGRGDRVVLWTSGCPEWALVTFALWRLGAVAVPIDPQWPGEEVEQAARFVRAKLICAAPRIAATLSDAQVPVVKLAEPFVPEPDVELLPGAAARAPSGSADDLASILFTSGTTLAPKAVPLTHANYLANVNDLVPLMQLQRERLLSVLPVHHVFEQMVGLLVPLVGGSTISYVAEIKPAEISWTMSVTRPTVLVAVPRLLELLHNGIQQSVAAGGPFLGAYFKVLFALSKLTGGRYGHRLFAKVHQRFGGSLRRIATGGTALDPDLGRSFFRMGFAVAEGYGMTETAPVLTVNPWPAIRFGSAGVPLPGVDLDLRPVDGEDISNDDGFSVGEIWVRGGNVMSGYFENPQASAEVMDGEWLNTGDTGYLDQDGYLYVSGRTKEVIITSAGKNVYPEEVERRYRDLPHVQELVVVGLPGPSGGGETVSAVVVPSPEAREQEIDELHEALRARSQTVPSYQQITRVELWQGELPKTTTLKVKRAALRDAVVAGRGGDAGSRPARTQPDPAASAPRDKHEQWTLQTLARLTRSREDDLRAEDRLAELGVDSLTRVELVAAVEERFSLTIADETAVALDRVQDLFELVAPRSVEPLSAQHAQQEVPR